MKKFILLVSAILFCLASGVVSASSNDVKPDPSRVIPVLVHVNAKGEVTDATPAYKLRPSLTRVIRNTVEKMITKPATSHGKPVACQFVINLAMTTGPAKDGKYNTTFKYISSKSLPSGSWYWARTQDHRLTLANQNTNTQINPASYKSALRQQADATNGAAMQNHASFMNRVNGGH